MSSTSNILLPGMGKQLDFLRKNVLAPFNCVLIIGSGCEKIAKQLSKYYFCNVELILEDYESFLKSNLALNDDEKVKPNLMSYETTDFGMSYFDLVYAQASVSFTNRNKIIKEINRILRPGGFFCVGEIVSLKKEIPPFIKDIFDSSNIKPLFIEDLDRYYEERKFKIIAKQDFSDTLKNYYSQTVSLFRGTKENLSDMEKSYYKKLLNKVNHESNVYLKLGGDKYIGFVSLLMQKGGY